jgi:hypothetical protein
MKPTKVNSIKTVVQRKLHPPLPLDRRQSQRLVNLISTSFRQKLDDEHHQANTNPRPIDAHLKAILTNPLFQRPTPIRRLRRHDDTSRRPSIGQEASPSGLSHFNEQCARGTATIQQATSLLRGIPSQMSKQTVEDSQRRIEAVLKWLWSSGLENSMAFVEDRHFVQALMRSLAALNREDVLWRWQQKLLEMHSLKSPAHDPLLAKDTLVAENSAPHKRALAMVGCYWQARFKMATTSNDCAIEMIKMRDCPITDDKWKTRIFRAVSQRFVEELLERHEAELIDADLYHQITQDDAIYNTMSPAMQASLALFAPEPDASAAFGLLNQELTWLMMPNASARTWKRRALFALRTMNVLLDQSRHEDAAQIGALVAKYLWRGPHPTDVQGRSSEDSQRLPSILQDLLSSQSSHFVPDSS